MAEHVSDPNGQCVHCGLWVQSIWNLPRVECGDRAGMERVLSNNLFIPQPAKGDASLWAEVRRKAIEKRKSALMPCQPSLQTPVAACLLGNFANAPVNSASASRIEELERQLAEARAEIAAVNTQLPSTKELHPLVAATSRSYIPRTLIGMGMMGDPLGEIRTEY